MNLISTKTYNGIRLSADIALDTDLIRNIKRSEENGVITCTYNLESSCSELPFNTTEAFLVVSLSRNNLYISGVVYVDADSETGSSPFIEEDTYECNVIMSETERLLFTHTLLRALCFI